jgi:hypothetical protein
MEGPLLRFFISSRSVYKHRRHMQFFFLVGRFLKIFSSETTWQNCTGSINANGRSSIGLLHNFPIGQKTWSSWTILVSDWLKFKTSSPLKLGGTMNC